MSIEQLVQDSAAPWTRRPPATGRVLTQLRSALPALPMDYFAFLQLSNGGEGELGLAPGWFQLWPAEEVLELNRQYAIAEFLPGYIGFGSNAGDELFAFAPTGAVVMVPFIPMGIQQAREIAPSFAHLVRAFGHGAPAS